MKNRPMEGTNTSTHPAITPGAVSGSVTVKNARTRPAPRSRPASTTDQSSFSTEVYVGRIIKGISAYTMPSSTAP